MFHLGLDIATNTRDTECLSYTAEQKYLFDRSLDLNDLIKRACNYRIIQAEETLRIYGGHVRYSHFIGAST